MSDELTDEERQKLHESCWQGVALPTTFLAVESIIAAHVRRALEDAADAWQQGQWSDALSGTQRPDPIQARLAAAQAVTDWLRARAEAHGRPPVDIPDRAVAPRETKD